MTDPRTLSLERELRSRTALRAACDPPDRDTAAWLSEQLRAVRDALPRADVLRLETLAERLCGTTPPLERD